jgi:hypothetical protein
VSNKKYEAILYGTSAKSTELAHRYPSQCPGHAYHGHPRISRISTSNDSRDSDSRDCCDSWVICRDTQSQNSLARSLGVSPVTPLLVGRFFPWGVKFGTVIVTGATLIPGFYWFFTSRRNCPLPLENPIFLNRPILASFLTTGLVAVLIITPVLVSFSLPWWPPMLDCMGGPLLNEQGAPRGTDFTAKVLFVGPASYRGWSFWAIARVEQ